MFVGGTENRASVSTDIPDRRRNIIGERASTLTHLKILQFSRFQCTISTLIYNQPNLQSCYLRFVLFLAVLSYPGNEHIPLLIVTNKTAIQYL
jgi:hypothetical protein